MGKQSLLVGLLSLLFSFPYLLSAQSRDQRLKEMGMVDIALADSTIAVSLLYASPDNIFGEAVYEGLTKAWLRPEAAAMLLNAQQLLQTVAPSHRLIVFDAARPMAVQRKMWQLVRETDKTNYVSNPANGGGLHNYGMAVDVSILDPDGKLLPMGSPIDHFGVEAHTDQEQSLVASGKISAAELANRQLLRRVMQQAGFRTIRYEWWHFNGCTREEARQRFPVIDE